MRGFLDNVQTSEIAKFEQKFIDTLHSRHSDILAAIRNEGVLSKETDDKLKAILQDFIPSAGLAMKG